MDSERHYVDLIHHASKKYASWDPEVVVEPGDWGRITKGRPGWAFWRRRRGIFLKEGNIYKDGIAEKYSIPPPKEQGANSSHGVTWIASQNTRDLDVSGSVGVETPALAKCSIKAGFHFTSGCGAILAMDNDTISTIDPPGSLRRLLGEDVVQNRVIVSEVHRTSSYARYLSSPRAKRITIGLSVEPPMPGVVSAQAHVKWVRSSAAGNFKSKVNQTGDRDYYPLFRLVTLKETDTSVGLRGSSDEEIPPLPDAELPWLAAK
ncbi:hypothetical protein HYDPIDRAFT_29275 [Hydnomerulius pinastri MD-312]|uniref:Uncharacterized protein n=1 Tax=Hydnomerulius pinastri MD-312 TaxID=994086 RepID=A0A0C9W7Y1_9AGAM|nr:hypothetical protein HYDPIDRAFT_29275 [Hydnomerulius pinastri MD-312]